MGCNLPGKGRSKVAGPLHLLLDDHFQLRDLDGLPLDDGNQLRDARFKSTAAFALHEPLDDLVASQWKADSTCTSPNGTTPRDMDLPVNGYGSGQHRSASVPVNHGVRLARRRLIQKRSKSKVDERLHYTSPTSSLAEGR
jgi:hypothetical protein